MSDSSVLESIDISQSSRFFYWHVSEFPIPRREIERSASNMHLIPADDGVRRALKRVRRGELVHIEGFLVDASRPDGWHWRSSLSRDDTGDGACELVYVEELEAVAQGRRDHVVHAAEVRVHGHARRPDLAPEPPGGDGVGALLGEQARRGVDESGGGVGLRRSRGHH